MAKMFEELPDNLIEFIQNQHIFFVGTAAAEGTINISPKGMDSLRILDPKKVIWLNVTGSGNETAAHLLKINRMTIMFCSFEKKPLILRLYGTAKAYHPRDKEYEDYSKLLPQISGARQIFELNIDRVQTSCGYAVPFMDFVEERKQLESWATKQGTDRIKTYWKEKNVESIDGFETKILDK